MAASSAATTVVDAVIAEGVAAQGDVDAGKAAVSAVVQAVQVAIQKNTTGKAAEGGDAEAGAGGGRVGTGAGLKGAGGDAVGVAADGAGGDGDDDGAAAGGDAGAAGVADAAAARNGGDAPQGTGATETVRAGDGHGAGNHRKGVGEDGA